MTIKSTGVSLYFNYDKEDGKGAESVISQEQLVEALTVKKGNDKKDSKPAEEESTSSEEDDYG
mgnify:CR=1 FL=1